LDIEKVPPILEFAKFVFTSDTFMISCMKKKKKSFLHLLENTKSLWLTFVIELKLWVSLGSIRETSIGIDFGIQWLSSLKNTA
jgi:hypothetical protein